MPVETIPGRWLKNKKDGTIYGYSDLLAGNPNVYEVSEEVAFPERYIPAAQQGRTTRISLDGVTPPAEPTPSKPEIAEEVTQDVEKKAVGRAGAKRSRSKKS